MNKNFNVMHNLFIVQSPFQLLSAIEGANYFKGDKNTLIISYTPDHKNNQQIPMVLGCYKHWENVIELAPSGSTFLGGLKLLSEMKKLNKAGYKPSRVFIGEYRSRYMTQFFQTMNPQECFLLDDGNITIELQEKYLKENRPYGGLNIKGVAKDWLLFFITGLRQNEKKLIHLFTCFDLLPFDTRQRVIKHSFEFARSFAQTKVVEQSKIYFFGGNFSGQGMLPVKRELELIEAAKKYYEKLNLEMVYIPHRLESEDKIKLIQNALKLDTIQFAFPAEIELLRLGALPRGIASFFSTVLFTLPRICSFASVDAFKFPLSELPEHYRPEVEQTYLNYGKTMRVIEIS